MTNEVVHEVKVPVMHEVPVKCLAGDAEEFLKSLTPVPPPSVCMVAQLCYVPQDAVNLAENIGKLIQRVREDDALCSKKLKETP